MDKKERIVLRNGTLFKKVLLGVLAVAMVLSLNISGIAKTKSVTLEWQQWWAVECPKGYVQNIVDTYYKKTGVKINLLSAPFADTKTQIVSGASTGTVADIVSVDSSWVYDFADQGLLTDMTTLMKKDGFNSNIAKTQWQVNNKTYAIPIVNYAYPMFVNKDILKKAGVTKTPRTWTEFEECCKQIKATGAYPFALNLDTSSPSGIQNTYMGFAWASGIKMKTDRGEYNLANNADLKTFAAYMKGLYTKGYIYPGMSSLTEADMTSKFSSGNIAFIISSAAILNSFRKESPNLNIGAVPIPVKDDYTGKSGMCVASWALGVTEKSKHKAEAMKFVEYLLSGFSGKDGSIDANLAVTQSAFPGSSLAQPNYSKADPVFQSIYDMYKKGFPINEFTGMKEANAIMTDYINELIPYMDGKVDVDKFFGNVQQNIASVYGKKK
jgi:multiple sugar transport system substrate-binding protein